MVMLLGGCGKAEKWAYTHEPDKEVLTLYDNGKAVFKDKEYTYTKDDTFYTLTDKQGNSEKHRYEMDKENMIFYEASTYQYDGEKTGSGIAGVWKQDNGWMFEFTKDGKFNEDGYFYGHYNVKENEGTIKLMYSDPLQDRILYYTLDGDKLTIEYPWPMMHVSDKTNDTGQVTVPDTTNKDK
jgi:hypothetical protein